MVHDVAVTLSGKDYNVRTYNTWFKTYGIETNAMPTLQRSMAPTAYYVTGKLHY